MTIAQLYQQFSGAGVPDVPASVDALMARRVELVEELRALDTELKTRADAILSALTIRSSSRRGLSDRETAVVMRKHYRMCRESGLCYRCRQPVGTRKDGRKASYCDKHLAEKAAYNASYYRARKAAQS